MTTIYIVTDGDYSDYSIHGVFSSRENAQAMIDAEGMSFASIEEWELDEDIDWYKSKYRRWLVAMDYYTGDVKRADEVGIGRPDDKVKYYPGRPGEAIVSTEVLTTSRGHAIKVANERRIKFIIQSNPEGELARRLQK